MILTNSDIDKDILLQYLKKCKFNVMGKIESINTWSEQTTRDTYTMTLTVPMRVGMLDRFNTENWSVVTQQAYFTINKGEFDLFYNQTLRDNSIKRIIYEKGTED